MSVWLATCSSRRSSRPGSAARTADGRRRVSAASGPLRAYARRPGRCLLTRDGRTSRCSPGRDMDRKAGDHAPRSARGRTLRRLRTARDAAVPTVPEPGRDGALPPRWRPPAPRTRGLGRRPRPPGKREETTMTSPVSPATVVLVRGAFADSSSWSRVVSRLPSGGVAAVAPANPHRGRTSDGEYTASVVSQLDGPVLLVGHSYGGPVITYASGGSGGEHDRPALRGSRGPRRPAAVEPVHDRDRHHRQRRRAVRGQGPAPGSPAAPDGRRPARGTRLGEPVRGARAAHGLHRGPYRDRARGRHGRGRTARPEEGVHGTHPGDSLGPAGPRLFQRLRPVDLPHHSLLRGHEGHGCGGGRPLGRVADRAVAPSAGHLPRRHREPQQRPGLLLRGRRPAQTP
ncbi:hypothetical protein ACFV2H_05645 [Streptomyces sp. NPDC059629]|uniref:hypothetical protein n=1 Tax=Streptomyces sp. NPDC059629 TaxID=3346889 RepID=UPI003699E46C